MDTGEREATLEAAIVVQGRMTWPMQRGAVSVERGGQFQRHLREDRGRARAVAESRMRPRSLAGAVDRGVIHHDRVHGRTRRLCGEGGRERGHADICER